jgi:hypothetical protein
MGSLESMEGDIPSRKDRTHEGHTYGRKQDKAVSKKIRDSMTALCEMVKTRSV